MVYFKNNYLIYSMSYEKSNIIILVGEEVYKEIKKKRSILGIKWMYIWEVKMLMKNW